MKTRCIMIQGTMSDAGKSVVCAALCRIFKQDGYKVAPFKSQNMALNSYITRDGFEMGRAQVMQAEAAGIEPDVRMNPVLLKPSSDTGSQVIVLGEIRDEMSAMEYHNYKKQLLPEVRKAFDELAAENDIIVIEGAGSPAEINLAENDIVNMGLAAYLNAPVLLVGDIDRGGVFAQLYGTAELMTEEDRARIEGMIINKFRGDVKILEPGLEMLEEKTGIPVPNDWFYTLLRMPDVTTKTEVEELSDEEWNVVCQTIKQALKSIVDFRIQEGAALQKKFSEKIDNIEQLLASIAPYEQNRVEKIKNRIIDGLQNIPGVDYDRNRLEQELIYYIEKLDISEEKQRLTNHLKYFRETMDEPAGQGKKLGFIAQEMGREINTTGSKSNQAEMQNIVVQMKDELEQIKEQVLNAL